MSFRHRHTLASLVVCCVVFFLCSNHAQGFYLKKSIVGYETLSSQHLNYELTSDANVKELVSALFGGVTPAQTSQARLDHIKYFFSIPIVKDRVDICMRYYLQTCPKFTEKLLNEQSLTAYDLPQISYAIKLGGEVIGEVTLDNYDNEVLNLKGVAVSIFIAEEYTGQGFGSEAVSKILEVAQEIVDIDSVYWQCRSVNMPSLKLAKRLGFTFKQEFVSKQGEDKLLFIWQLQ